MENEVDVLIRDLRGQVARLRTLKGDWTSEEKEKFNQDCEVSRMMLASIYKNGVKLTPVQVLELATVFLELKAVLEKLPGYESPTPEEMAEAAERLNSLLPPGLTQ